MSASPSVRRADRVMTEERARDVLEHAFCGRLATVSPDGYPYIVPLLYVLLDGEVYIHNTAARGHLRANVDRNARVCFEIDEPDGVFDYGRFECDSGLAYRSVILLGDIRVVEDRAVKQRFYEALMAKYRPGTGRPENFFPRLDHTTVYAIKTARLTGKEMAMPPVSEQWPSVDRTKTPDARLP